MGSAMDRSGLVHDDFGVILVAYLRELRVSKVISSSSSSFLNQFRVSGILFGFLRQKAFRDFGNSSWR